MNFYANISALVNVIKKYFQAEKLPVVEEPIITEKERRLKKILAANNSNLDELCTGIDLIVKTMVEVAKRDG
jgi:hypothetical protein